MGNRGEKRRSVDTANIEDYYDYDFYESTEEESDEQDPDYRGHPSYGKPKSVSSKTRSKNRSFVNQAEPPRCRPGPACSKRKPAEASTNNQLKSASPSLEAAPSATSGSSEQNSRNQLTTSTPQPGSAHPMVQKSFSHPRNRCRVKHLQIRKSGSKETIPPSNHSWESGNETAIIFSTRSLRERTLPWSMRFPQESPVVSGQNAPQLQSKPSPKDFKNESKIGTEEERTKFVNVMRHYPNLYNWNDPSYIMRDPEKRAESWNAISKKLGMSVVRCQKRWKSMREHYCHSMKRLAQTDNVSLRTRKYLEDMNFIPYRQRAAANPRTSIVKRSKKSPENAFSIVVPSETHELNHSSIKVETVVEAEVRSQSLKPDQPFLDEIAQQLQNYLPHQKVELKTKILRVFVKYNRNICDK